LTLVAHALTPALRGLVLGGGAEPDRSSLKAAGGLKVVADQVFSGPEPAAVQTAEALGLAPTVDQALRDRYYGNWNGRSLEDLMTAEAEPVAAWLKSPRTAPPGGESAADFTIRAANWLAALPGRGVADELRSARQTVVAVVHPAVVRAMVLHVLDAPPESVRRLDVRPLSVVQLSEHAGNWSFTLTPSSVPFSTGRSGII
jgi:broad specificity phosphatase PhoE